MQDLESNVRRSTSSPANVLWETNIEEPDQGPNGVTVDEGMVFGATATKRLRARRRERRRAVGDR